MSKTVCDGCKYQRRDGKCMHPRRAWELEVSGKNCKEEANHELRH